MTDLWGGLREILALFSVSVIRCSRSTTDVYWAARWISEALFFLIYLLSLSVVSFLNITAATFLKENLNVFLQESSNKASFIHLIWMQHQRHLFSNYALSSCTKQLIMFINVQLQDITAAWEMSTFVFTVTSSCVSNSNTDTCWERSDSWLNLGTTRGATSTWEEWEQSFPLTDSEVILHAECFSACGK